jgi:hypothetical protein
MKIRGLSAARRAVRINIVAILPGTISTASMILGSGISGAAVQHAGVAVTAGHARASRAESP